MSLRTSTLLLSSSWPHHEAKKLPNVKDNFFDNMFECGTEGVNNKNNSIDL
jgi:hypothetical protein